MSLYDQLGGFNQIHRIISKFYDKAFADPIIGHFFFGKDKSHLIHQQSHFAATMLGGKTHPYHGPAMSAAHSKLRINNAHFGRRQVLMRETLEEEGVATSISQRWLQLEEGFRSLILNQKSTDCQHLSTGKSTP